MMIEIELAEAERMLESAERGVESARETLAKKLADGENAERLAGGVNFLAECEGAVAAISRLVSVLRYNERGNDVEADPTGVLLETLLRGPDDEWSGRTNDVKRAEFDGFRKQTARLTRGF